MFNTIRPAAAAAIFAGCTLFVSTAGAQATPLLNPFSIGISGGVAIPTGDLASGTSGGFPGVGTGYNVTGSLGIGLPVLPLSLRGDVSYNEFGGKYGPITANNADGIDASADVRVLNVTANVVLPVHLPVPIIGLSSYLIGGIGDYDVRFSPRTGGTISSRNFGFNIGAGVKVPLILFDAFIEARYNRVDQSNGGLAFVPITVGVMF